MGFQRGAPHGGLALQGGHGRVVDVPDQQLSHVSMVTEGGGHADGRSLPGEPDELAF